MSRACFRADAVDHDIGAFSFADLLDPLEDVLFREVDDVGGAGLSRHSSARPCEAPPPCRPPSRSDPACNSRTGTPRVRRTPARSFFLLPVHVRDPDLSARSAHFVLQQLPARSHGGRRLSGALDGLRLFGPANAVRSAQSYLQVPGFRHANWISPEWDHIHQPVVSAPRARIHCPADS